MEQMIHPIKYQDEVWYKRYVSYIGDDEKKRTGELNNFN